jgi:hypothetical protein
LCRSQHPILSAQQEFTAHCASKGSTHSKPFCHRQAETERSGGNSSLA